MCDVIGPIYSGHVPFHAIKICKVRLQSVFLSSPEIIFPRKSSLRNFIAMGAEIFPSCWIKLGSPDLKAAAFPIALAGPSGLIVYYLLKYSSFYLLYSWLTTPQAVILTLHLFSIDISLFLNILCRNFNFPCRCFPTTNMLGYTAIEYPLWSLRLLE